MPDFCRVRTRKQKITLSSGDQTVSPDQTFTFFLCLGEEQRRRKRRRGFQSPLPQKKETKHGNSLIAERKQTSARR
jgi:hypothetical protein